MQESNTTYMKVSEEEITYISYTEINNSIENSQVGGNASQNIANNHVGELLLMQEIRILQEKILNLEHQVIKYKKVITELIS